MSDEKKDPDIISWGAPEGVYDNTPVLAEKWRHRNLKPQYVEIGGTRFVPAARADALAAAVEEAVRGFQLCLDNGTSGGAAIRSLLPDLRAALAAYREEKG